MRKKTITREVIAEELAIGVPGWNLRRVDIETSQSIGEERRREFLVFFDEQEKVE